MKLTGKAKAKARARAKQAQANTSDTVWSSQVTGPVLKLKSEVGKDVPIVTLTDPKHIEVYNRLMKEYA